MSIFDPPSSANSARAARTAAASSVQSALFARLRQIYPVGSQRAAIAWAIVRVGQGDHPGTAAARAEFAALPADRLAPILALVRGARAASPEKSTQDRRDLLGAIERELGAIGKPAAQSQVYVAAIGRKIDANVVAESNRQFDARVAELVSQGVSQEEAEKIA